MLIANDNLVPILMGKLVRLRPPCVDDITARQAQGYNQEFRRMVGATQQHHGPMSHNAAQRWYETQCTDPHTWIIEWQARAIGTTRLHQLDESNRRARYSIGIFDPTCWGQGLGTESTVLVLGYAFNVLNLHRVDLRVLAYNKRAIRSYEKAGFVQEGIEREGAWINERWESDVCMSILEDEYRSLHAHKTSAT